MPAKSATSVESTPIDTLNFIPNLPFVIQLVFVPAEVRQGVRDRRQVPTPGRQRPNFTINPYVENSGPSGANRSFELRSKIGGSFHGLAFGAHRSGHHGVVGGEELSTR